MFYVQSIKRLGNFNQLLLLSMTTNVLNVTAIVIGKGCGDLSSNPGQSILLSINTIGKGMNPPVLQLQAMGK